MNTRIVTVYDTQLVWFHDGDFDFTDPLNLDRTNEVFGAGAAPDFPLFIMIKGNARLGNVFNYRKMEQPHSTRL